jgi:hypothetical protein
MSQTRERRVGENKFAMQWMLPFGLKMMIKLIAKRMRAEDGATLVPNPFQSRGENVRSIEFKFQEFFFSQGQTTKYVGWNW